MIKMISLTKEALRNERYIVFRTLKLTCLLVLTTLSGTTLEAQMDASKKFSLSIGGGYFSPILEDEGIAYPDAAYSPEVGPGLSYFASVDYSLTESFYVGLGFNGNYARGEFINNAVVNGTQVDGYLEAGAVSNAGVLLNLTYAPQKAGFQPYAKLGIGYFKQQVELGDVPLNLTDNVEFELFPDYKFTGLGAIPEIGLKYNALSLSAAYGFPFGKLTGEEVSDAYTSVGSISSQSLQINFAYRILLF